MAFKTSQAEPEVINGPPEEENYLQIVTKRKTLLTCMVFLTYITADSDVLKCGWAILKTIKYLSGTFKSL